MVERVLIVKTSSMGDVIHALPALSDAASALPHVEWHWMVEEAFQEIPGWHRHVSRVIPVAFRRWRKNPLDPAVRAEWRQMKKTVRAQGYTRVVDLQGLVKSGWLARQAGVEVHGPDLGSAREPLANLFYQEHHRVRRDQHAVLRNRQLLAASLDYPLTPEPDFGLAPWQPRGQRPVLFLHGTTWATKLWPQDNWRALAQRLALLEVPVLLPWGNMEEQRAAAAIASDCASAEVLPRCTLSEILQIMYDARAVVSVDTGLLHLAAAIGCPALSLYGPTDAQRTGSQGSRQCHLQSAMSCSPCLGRRCALRQQPAPCMQGLTPQTVYRQLHDVLDGS